ncbi:SDH family Clp fold serine proteinase [Phyllobacterium pellucidum]|uniref:SDH family Clp fold serine proteinase n=1 Tax=Phyllobacterium pellucidum TaxID=2740464 RepID=UPI001A9BDFE0
MAVYDEIIFNVAKEAEAELSKKLDADILFFSGEMRMTIFAWFRELIEKLAARPEKKQAIAIFLTTPGGQAEAVEKFVEVVRHHYKLVYFVVPVVAMSAGTIFCMSGDKIFMDYSSSLGPIDPQVLDREGKYLVPALGHLDKLNEMIQKSKQNTISPVEFQWMMNQDLAMLRFYEQARDLSEALLKRWLVQYKFKDWTVHKRRNGTPAVTDDDKRERAAEIAKLLSDNSHWHSHGRMIGMQTLKDECRLEIDDFGNDSALQGAVRRYNDTLSDFMSRMNLTSYLYTSTIN